MSRIRLLRVGLALPLALLAVGCQEQQQPPPKLVSTSDWTGWTGNTTIDPAGDVEKLQGKWDRIEVGGMPNKPGDAWLAFDRDVVIFDHAALPGTGERPDPRKYRFVLNSSVEPKVIGYIEWLGPGKPFPGFGTPRWEWYKLDGNILIIWNQHAERGESPKYRYMRVSNKD